MWFLWSLRRMRGPRVRLPRTRIGLALLFVALVIAYLTRPVQTPVSLPANYLGSHISVCGGWDPPRAVVRDYKIPVTGTLYDVTCSDGAVVQVVR